MTKKKAKTTCTLRIKYVGQISRPSMTRINGNNYNFTLFEFGWRYEYLPVFGITRCASPGSN